MLVFNPLSTGSIWLAANIFGGSFIFIWVWIPHGSIVGLLPADSGDHLWSQGSNLCRPGAQQAPYCTITLALEETSLLKTLYENEKFPLKIFFLFYKFPMSGLEVLWWVGHLYCKSRPWFNSQYHTVLPSIPPAPEMIL